MKKYFVSTDVQVASICRKPDDAPAGLCPKCLVEAGFESEVEPEPSAAGSDPAVRPTLKSPANSAAGFEPPSGAVQRPTRAA